MRLVTLTLGLALGVGMAAHGVNRTFNETDGNLWSTAANWTGGLVPDSNDQARLTVAGTTAVIDSAVPNVDSFLLGATGNAATLNIVSGGVLNTGTPATSIGALNAAGVLNINGGTLSMGGLFRVGANAAGTGTVTMTSGALSSTTTFAVGFNGTGTMTLSGGDVSSGGIFYVGQDAGSTGTMTVNGGSLNVGTTLQVGRAGNAYMTINGGTVSANDLWINNLNDANVDANLALLGGTLDVRSSAGNSIIINGDDTMHIEGGTLIWEGDRLAQLGTFIDAGAITWANGQAAMLGSYDVSWTNGNSVLYADYGNINAGQTTVWAIPEPGTVGLFSLAAVALLIFRRIV